MRAANNLPVRVGAVRFQQLDFSMLELFELASHYGTETGILGTDSIIKKG